MKIEPMNGPDLVPIERVAVPTVESSDKATRKMITQIEKTLGQCFSLEIGRQGLSCGDDMYIPIRSKSGATKETSLHMRQSDKSLSLSPDRPTNVISGMCMFGISGLTAATPTGEVISLTDPTDTTPVRSRANTVIASPLMHISEADSIYRLMNGLGVLAESRKFNEPLECSFHLPLPEYLLYIVKHFQSGRLTETAANQAGALIVQRSEAIKAMVAKRVPQGVNLRFMSPFESLLSVLQEKGLNTTLRECVRVLSQDPLLAELLRLCPVSGFGDLTNLSYLAGYVMTAQRSQEEGANAMALDIDSEVGIFVATQKDPAIARKVENMPVALILPQLVTTRGKNQKSALFLHQPNGTSPLSLLRMVAKDNKERRS